MFNFLIKKFLCYFDTLGQLGAFHGWGVPAGCMLVVCKPGNQRNGAGNMWKFLRKVK